MELVTIGTPILWIGFVSLVLVRLAIDLGVFHRDAHVVGPREATGVVFAVDSIPAIFAVTSDPFIVFTSNIFATLGLRSMAFLRAGVMEVRSGTARGHVSREERSHP